MALPLGPTVNSISRVTAAATNANSVQYTVTFSEAVTGVDVGDFFLTGSTSGSIALISGSGSVYTVTVDSITGDGTLRLDLRASGTGIQNGASNPIMSGYTSGAAYSVDLTGPVTSSVSVPANGSYIVGQQLFFTVNFNEAATVTGTPRLGVTLDTGGTVYANYVSGSGTRALVFDYVVAAGNLDADGIVLAAALNLNGGTIKDAVGNNATLSLNNVGATTGVLIVAPTAAPAFSSATVRGNSLVISYVETTTLDATNKPAAIAYEVKVGGVANAVTAVTIDAAAKTATLTLATAVTAGEAVTVAYTDPTLGDDANALQNAAGIDAITLLATMVTNNTVAPPVVIPSVSPVSVGSTVTAPVNGGELRGTVLNDTFVGSSVKDTIYPAGGADSIDGGGGIDTVVLTGARAQYTITHQVDGSFNLRSLVDSSSVVNLKNVERVSFDNQTLALDNTTSTGRVAEFYKLALGRNPEEGGLDFYLGISSQNPTTTQVALSFVSSLEFAKSHSAFDNATFLTQLYQSAFNRVPDAQGFAFYLKHLAENPGATGQASVIANFIDSPEMAIKLAGVVDQGVPLLVV